MNKDETKFDGDEVRNSMRPKPAPPSCRQQMMQLGTLIEKVHRKRSILPRIRLVDAGVEFDSELREVYPGLVKCGNNMETLFGVPYRVDERVSSSLAVVWITK